MNETITTKAGRPRNEDSKKAILKATFDLLKERGYSGLAMALIAERAGVGKPTIYRWWQSKAALAVESFFSETFEDIDFPNTNSADVDFKEQIQRLAELLRSERGSVLAALIIGSQTDKELAEAIQSQWVEPRKQWGINRMTKAVEQNECVPGLNIGLALDQLYSPLYAHLFLGIGVHSRKEIDSHCNFLFPLIFRK